jgi:hypothetical protein
MPDEPTRRIEAELNAYADQRRAEAGPPFALQPVNRRLLQDEVARTRGRTPARSQPDRPRLRWLWPRLAVAGALGGLGLFAVLRFTPDRTTAEYQIARAAAPAAEEQPGTATRPGAPVPEARAEPDRADRLLSAPPGVSSAEVGAVAATEATPWQAKPENAPEPEAKVAAAPRTPAAASSAEPMRSRYGLRPAPTRGLAEAQSSSVRPGANRLDEASTAAEPVRQPAVAGATADLADRRPQTLAAPAAASSVPAGPAQRGAAVTKSEADAFSFGSRAMAGSAQRFVQVGAYRQNFNSPAPPPVLRSFQLRQSGSAVEIEDADGSVYRGTFGRAGAPQAGRAESEGLEAPDQRASRDSTSPTIRETLPGTPGEATGAPWQFLAVGTNISLNQRVVFAGEFVMATNPPARGGVPAVRETTLRFAPTSAATVPVSPPPPRQLVPLLRIQGQALVGEGTKLEIKAQPASP